MARKPTKADQIAALEAQVKNAEKQLADVTRDRDYAVQAHKDALAMFAGGAKGDDVQRLRLAALAYPQDDPKSIGWDDLAQWFGQRRDDMRVIEDAAKAVAKSNDVSDDVTIVGMIEGIGEKLTDYRRCVDKVADAFGIDDASPEVIEKEVPEKLAKEGLGSAVREDAIELLRELGYDVACLLPKSDAGTMTTVALDDPHVIFTLRNQVRR